MHFKEKFEWFLKNSMEEEDTDKPSLFWKTGDPKEAHGGISPHAA